jgi:cytochrome c553
MRSRGAAVVSAVLMALMAACGGGGGPVGGGPTPTPPPSGERLSATGLYAPNSQEIAAGIRAWRPQYPLWSDGSAKSRFILIPAGAQIETSDMDRWVFPVGTKIWKEFSFGGRRVETRLIEKIAAGASTASWTFKSFQWLSDGSDAVLASSNGVKDVAPTAFGTTHDIPSVGECLGCHGRGGDAVLGFDSLQLSPDVDPLVLTDGQRQPGEITLDDLVADGLVTQGPSRAPRIRSSTDVGRWTMGFLHANCGNCHNPQGTAATVGLHLRHEYAATRESDEPTYRTAVNQLTSVFHTVVYRIEGGSPDTSALVVRMNSRTVGEQMPPSASKVVDADAVNRLREWIAGLPKP